MEGGYLYYDDSTLNKVPPSDRFHCPECDIILDPPEGLLEHLYEYHNWGDKRKGKKVLNISEHENMLEEFLEELSKGDGKKSGAEPSNSKVEPLKELGLELNLAPPKSPPVAQVQPLRLRLVDLNEEDAEVKRFGIDLNVDLNVPF
ncbi:hypothetical protein RHMOL_Rhmol01G0348900 [Rhododendron molle]|uniref:Uncharacterized protein n=1 Tax=Rhododendron molle TaxID=49168 RepID=A0ACC0QC15_RHOML|nr:hypothetical protein RHMOL_Rhmol01G0348900 [Rhododendron molle]